MRFFIEQEGISALHRNDIVEALRQRVFKSVEYPYQPHAFLIIMDMTCRDFWCERFSELHFERKPAQLAHLKINVRPAPRR